MKNCIYKIVNTVNGKCYIGSAVDFDRRVKKHKYDLKTGKHGNKHLQNSYKKYRDCFTFTALECDIDDEFLLAKEQQYINSVKPDYNICIEVINTRRGVKASEDTKNKIRLSHIGLKASEETREKLRISHLGQKVSKQERERRRMSMQGNQFGLGNLNKRKVTQEIYDQVLLLKTQGLGCRRIAKLIGLNKTTVLNIFNNKFNYG